MFDIPPSLIRPFPTAYSLLSGVCQVRPNILASLKDERELLIIRDAAEINKTESYTMITESPFVRTASVTMTHHYESSLCLIAMTHHYDTRIRTSEKSKSFMRRKDGRGEKRRLILVDF